MHVLSFFFFFSFFEVLRVRIKSNNLFVDPIDDLNFDSIEFAEKIILQIPVEIQLELY